MLILKETSQKSHRILLVKMYLFVIDHCSFLEFIAKKFNLTISKKIKHNCITET